MIPARGPVLRLLLLAVLLVIAYQIYSVMTGAPPPNRISIFEQSSFDNESSATTAPSQQQHRLPWYKQSYKAISKAAFDPDHAFTTEHLTTEERRALQERMVGIAQSMAQEAFGNKYDGRIPGTILDTQDQVDAMRSLVNCWTRGRWVKSSNRAPLLRHFQDPLYGSCDAKFYKTHGKNEQREAVKYTWEPSCPLPMTTVDPQQWCGGALKGRNLMLVGDLAQYQMHEILLDALRDGPVVCYGELNCKEHTICNEPKASYLRYFRNDVVSIARKVDKQYGHPSMDIVEWPFMANFILREYDIFILNRSPVVEDDTNFARQLTQTLASLRKSKPRALIIYRSSAIGHPHCDDADGPLEQPLDDEQQRQLPYGWSEYDRRNAIARTIVEAAGGLFIDLGALANLRPDGHIGGQDCLRYCIPGPLDAWVTILYNVMLGLEGALPLPEDNNLMS
ncbi:hypothetical protein O0I10_002319 [Lichtheimia ornata]|uniref:Uncharacterized protein n=1 Tax=Lichtheimia ornata TaxID=688661 RepID=A0AAD7Y242_9FUNG|nr:uncharacterized protein O0I10_002319 [Lichtheimia ornata]KAJ8661988.1 hypothetical protein O0I10_002319 [Lichtheimia ornata]